MLTRLEEHVAVCGCLGSWAALQPLHCCREGWTNGHCMQVAGQGQIDAGLTRSLEAFQDAVLLCDSQTEWKVVFVNNPARKQLGELLAQAPACKGSYRRVGGEGQLNVVHACRARSQHMPAAW